MSFYGIHDGPKVDRLDSACEVYDERIPADLIPIADDANGNAICIGWTGEREVKIYFWDHEDELDENGDLGPGLPKRVPGGEQPSGVPR